MSIATIPACGHDGLQPGRLWSLLGIMQIFQAKPVLFATRTIAEWAAEHKNDESVVAPEWASKQAKAMRTAESFFANQGLVASWASIESIIEKFSAPCMWNDVVPLCHEFIGRYAAELKGKLFFSLTPREMQFFGRPRTGWELAINRWPVIVDDVEEAYKCFALSRYPAAVFHATQIVELALVELGKFLKVTDPKSGWTAVSAALSNTVKKPRRDMTRFEKKHFAFLEQMQGCVEGLKNAWRNKIGHATGRLMLLPGELNPDVTEEILLSSRAFVRRLAEGLPAAKNASSEQSS